MKRFFLPLLLIAALAGCASYGPNEANPPVPGQVVNGVPTDPTYPGPGVHVGIGIGSWGGRTGGGIGLGLGF